MRYESWVIDDKQKAGWRRAAFGQTREHAQTAEQKQIFAHDVFADMYGLVSSFQDYIPGNGFLEGPWVGFKHFTAFLTPSFFGA